MTEKIKNVFFVNCDFAFFRQNFRKSKNAEIIVFEEVRKRLASREVQKERPSDEIVRFHIAKRVNNFLKSSRTEFLYYYMEDMSPPTVVKLRKFAKSEGVRAFLLVEDQAAFDSLSAQFDNVLLIKDSLLR